jgi:hypothetical protein
MRKFTFVVWSNPTAGQEQAFNHWYDTVHLDEVLAVPGFTRARRFRVRPEGDAAAPFAYLALYDIEADDPAPVLADLRARAADGTIRMSPALGTVSTTLVERV